MVPGRWQARAVRRAGPAGDLAGVPSAFTEAGPGKPVPGRGHRLRHAPHAGRCPHRAARQTPAPTTGRRSSPRCRCPGRRRDHRREQRQPAARSGQPGGSDRPALHGRLPASSSPGTAQTGLTSRPRTPARSRVECVACISMHLRNACLRGHQRAVTLAARARPTFQGNVPLLARAFFTVIL